MKRSIILALALALMTASCANQEPTRSADQQRPGPIEAGEDLAVVSTTNGDVRGYIDDASSLSEASPTRRRSGSCRPSLPSRGTTFA